MRIRFHREARAAPDVIDGLKVPYASPKRNAPRWRWYLILAVVLSPALWLVLKTAGTMLTWSANGSIFLEPYEVRAPQNGRITAVKVRVGAEVAAGDVMMVLQDAELDATIADARVRMTTTPEASPPDDKLLMAELSLRRQALHRQQERLAAIQELVREGAATAAELREAHIAVDQTTAAVLSLQRQVAPPSRPVPTNMAAVNEARRVLDRLLVRREGLTVRAPEGGRVLDVLATEGEFVGTGASLLLIGRAADPQVIAYVSPDIAPKLSVGSRATIRFPDGNKAQAFVAQQPMLTRQMPTNLVDQFGVRPMTVVLHLQSDRAWPAGQLIHGLPVMIRFHYRWEPERIPLADSPAQQVRAVE